MSHTPAATPPQTQASQYYLPPPQYYRPTPLPAMDPRVQQQLQQAAAQNQYLMQQLQILQHKIQHLEDQAVHPSSTAKSPDVRVALSIQSTLTKTLPSFDGKRSKYLEWTRDVQAHLTSLNATEYLPATTLVTIISTAFRGQAKAWWSTKCINLPIDKQPCGGFESLEALFTAMNSAFIERMSTTKARSRLLELKQRTSVDVYAQAFAEIVPYIADASKGELAYAFYRGLKPEVVKHLTSRTNLETDPWTVIRDQATDLDEVMHSQGRQARSLSPEPHVPSPDARTPSPEPRTPAPYTPATAAAPVGDGGDTGGDAMDWSVNAVTSTKQPLTDSERTYLIEHGGCFKCRKLGHKSFQCPSRHSRKE